MIKTAIEWYTLDEKLPYDGKILGLNDETKILCVIETKVCTTLSYITIEQLEWLDGKVMTYYDGEIIDCTENVKYWAYVPEIGEY